MPNDSYPSADMPTCCNRSILSSRAISKGALNGGATVAEAMAVRHVAMEMCKAAGMVM